MNSASQAQAPDNRPAPAKPRWEFSANAGKWPFKRITSSHDNAPEEMIEFKVMSRPFKALRALREEIGNQIGPQLAG